MKAFSSVKAAVILIEKFQNQPQCCCLVPVWQAPSARFANDATQPSSINLPPSLSKRQPGQGQPARAFVLRTFFWKVHPIGCVVSYPGKTDGLVQRQRRGGFEPPFLFFT